VVLRPLWNWDDSTGLPRIGSRFAALMRINVKGGFSPQCKRRRSALAREPVIHSVQHRRMISVRRVRKSI
jgi:hypothetical protein